MKRNAMRALIVPILLASLSLAQDRAKPGVSSGQERAKPALSPVPLWPQDENVPEEMKNQTVFFNPETNEMIVLTKDVTGRKTLRFELHNQTEIFVNTHFSKQQDGLFIYEYALSTGDQSRRPLKTWSLLVPGDDRQFKVLSPSMWRVEQRTSSLVDKLAARHAPLVFIDYSPVSETGLGVGHNATGFRLMSSYLPGYVTTFARSVVQIEWSSEQLATLPKSIADEVQRATAPEWDSQMKVVVGPRFAPDTSKEMIADGFHYAISSFARQGLLNEESKFVKMALSSLHTYLQSGANTPFTPSQLTFLSSAQTPLEKEVAAAMQISLSATR